MRVTVCDICGNRTENFLRLNSTSIPPLPYFLGNEIDVCVSCRSKKVLIKKKLIEVAETGIDSFIGEL